jgi:hypothetical protein
VLQSVKSQHLQHANAHPDMKSDPSFRLTA